MKISTYKRISKAYLTVGTIFGAWFSPIITGVLISVLRIAVGVGRIFDRIFFPNAINKKLEQPIMIVGNPRSGTTFLHRYLVKVEWELAANYGKCCTLLFCFKR